MDVLSFVSSDSTASDLVGHGRTIDRLFVSPLARRLDSFVASRLRHGALENPTYSEHNQAPWLDYEFVSDTDSTETRAGLGHTLDTVLSASGRRLERLISSVAERLLGAGPNVVVARLLSPIFREPVGCAFRCGVANTMIMDHGWWTSATAPPLFKVLLEALTAYYCPSCQQRISEALQKQRGVVKDCRRLIKHAKTGTSATKLLAIQYMALLASVIPLFRSVLIEHGANEVVERVRAQAYLWRDRREVVAELLVPSQRALASLSESTCLSVVKEVDALTAFGESSYAARTLITRPTLRHVDEGIAMLVQFLRDPAYDLPAALCLREVIHSILCMGLYVKVQSHFDRAVIEGLWWQAAVSSDPVSRRALLRLLRAIYGIAKVLSEAGWDPPSDLYAGQTWTWHCLWMPLFRFRVQFPDVLWRIPLDYLEGLCTTFSNNGNYAPYIVLDGVSQSLDVVRLTELLPAEGHRGKASERDPVGDLLQEIAVSPSNMYGIPEY